MATVSEGAVRAAATASATAAGSQSSSAAAANAAAKAKAPPSPRKRDDPKKKWYSTEVLLSNRVPIGFVMHMGAMYLLRHHHIAMQFAIIPLIWWELAREFPNRRKRVMALLCLLTLFDIYRFELSEYVTPPPWLSEFLQRTTLLQLYGGRAVLLSSLGAISGVKLVDNITVNYLLVGLSSVVFLMSEFPIEVLLTISMGIAGSDCIQYFAGKLFGRTKIVPRISPNKSLEGYLAGVALCNAIYLGWLADYSVVSFTQGAVYVNGMLIAGILGDLFISWWKRNHHIKDTSTLLLAHGGFLDRLDSHIGAWVWSVGFVFYNDIKFGALFTPMDYGRILILIGVTWTIIWGHFFATRLM